MDIQDKTALVTGAGDGIGRATALMLAESGVSSLILIDINEDNLLQVASEVVNFGAKATSYGADLRDVECVKTLYTQILKDHEQIDIVFNNAGIMAGLPVFPDQPIDRMVDVINLNLIAMMVGSKLTIDHWRSNKQTGVIINTASTAAFNPMPADPAYATSKVAILRFCESCAPLHESDNIRVMAVCPGMVDTAIVPFDAEWLQPALEAMEMLEPNDIAKAVKQIIEDDSLAGSHISVENKLRS